ncbi:predicted protein [Lichtheimia corymbifera JMRC:FSU:9682]|uniref:HMG box domain-containing protein n=1 Tax=Lichtheimia corymbifera JMRC:FSU:9682 TaxID=1263082 RepID=A0A068SD32_9FUNG|nr:predicted protein [Lichtheimia corymbifera JMRC:FSU:9682]
MSTHSKLAKAYRTLARDFEAVADLLDATKTDTIESSNEVTEKDDKIEKKKNKRKTRDPNMPKQPKSAYILFSMDKREEVKKEMGGNVREVMSELARRWQALSDDEKQPYVARAAEEKDKHEKEMEEYRSKKATDEGKEEPALTTNTKHGISPSSDSDSPSPAEPAKANKTEHKTKPKKHDSDIVSHEKTKKSIKKKDAAINKKDKPTEKPKQGIKKKEPSSSTPNKQPKKKAKKDKSSKLA